MARGVCIHTKGLYRGAEFRTIILFLILSNRAKLAIEQVLCNFMVIDCLHASNEHFIWFCGKLKAKFGSAVKTLDSRSKMVFKKFIWMGYEI